MPSAEKENQMVSIGVSSNRIDVDFRYSGVRRREKPTPTES
jgi:hypothetical protein